MNINRWIWVTFQKEGVHCYPAASSDTNLLDVSFLGFPHRHIFYFKVSIEVNHNDRDIEFIQFKRWLQSLYDEKILNLDYKSCEMITEDLYEKITKHFPRRSVKIDVSEDNENGSYIEFLKEEE